MQFFISSLTAAMLLVHALLGCCWHHAHSCIGCEDSAARMSAETATCCEHCQDRHHDDGPNRGQRDHSSTPSPCKCSLECSTVCAYLPTPKTQVHLPQIVAPFDLMMDAPARAYGQISRAPWELAGGFADLPPPLRVHLLHQVLLI